MCMLLQPQCIASKPSVKSIKHLDMKVCLERSSAPNINRLADDAKVMQMHALESAFGGYARSTGGCFVRCFPHPSRVRSRQHRLAFAYFMLLHRFHPFPAHRVSSLFDAGGWYAPSPFLRKHYSLLILNVASLGLRQDLRLPPAYYSARSFGALRRFGR